MYKSFFFLTICLRDFFLLILSKLNHLCKEIIKCRNTVSEKKNQKPRHAVGSRWRRGSVLEAVEAHAIMILVPHTVEDMMWDSLIQSLCPLLHESFHSSTRSTITSVFWQIDHSFTLQTYLPCCLTLRSARYI